MVSIRDYRCKSGYLSSHNESEVGKDLHLACSSLNGLIVLSFRFQCRPSKWETISHYSTI